LDNPAKITAGKVPGLSFQQQPKGACIMRSFLKRLGIGLVSAAFLAAPALAGNGEQIRKRDGSCGNCPQTDCPQYGPGCGQGRGFCGGIGRGQGMGMGRGMGMGWRWRQGQGQGTCQAGQAGQDGGAKPAPAAQQGQGNGGGK
jgi:hypothetical protein